VSLAVADLIRHSPSAGRRLISKAFGIGDRYDVALLGRITAE